MIYVCKAIEHLHSHFIIHRDIKPENIIFNPEPFSVKLIDFGLSIKVKHNKLKKLPCVGTAYYIAPEVLKRFYSFKCDEWSLGVVWYILLTGTPPFNDYNEKLIPNKILNSTLEFPKNKSISIKNQNLIKSLLERDINKRKTATEILNLIS